MRSASSALENPNDTKRVVTQVPDDDPPLDDMPADIDFTDDARPVIGKHAAKSGKEVRLVRLDPDVAARFPDAEAGNSALRTIISVESVTNG